MQQQSPTIEERALAHDMHQLACRMRGEFINGTAWIEVLLTDILSHYFCSEKNRRLLFFSDVADTMTFRAKTLLLRKILEHEFPDILKQHPKLCQRLDRFRKFRNILAHNHLDTSGESMKKRKPNEVIFVVYDRGKIARVRVSANDAKQRAQEANDLRRELLGIQRCVFRGDEAAAQ